MMMSSEIVEGLRKFVSTSYNHSPVQQDTRETRDDIFLWLNAHVHPLLGLCGAFF